MATKAALFNVKIQSLNDYYLRLVNGSVPAPSGTDIATTLGSFSQTLLGVLKDIHSCPYDMLKKRNLDEKRLLLFPSLNYQKLYDSLTQIVDIIPLIQFGVNEMVQALLHTTTCLMVFLERELVDTLPYNVSSLMTCVPDNLHQSVVDCLCYKILPFTVGAPPLPNDEDENYAAASVPAILMLIFQYSENPAHHSQLLECLLSLKADVITDLFSVLAHGPPCSRPPAANLLFHYWPNLNPTLNDRKGFQIRFQDISCVLKAMFNRSTVGAKSDSLTQAADFGEVKSPKGWKPPKCQVDECEGEGLNESAKICLNHSVALGVCPETPPPLYVCKNCYTSHFSKTTSTDVIDIIMPMTSVPVSCENKNCRATEKQAVVTCFNLECASYHSNKPIRYCSQCHNIRHNNRRGIDHIYHCNITNIWTLEQQPLNYVLEAIVSLLNEAPPSAEKHKAQERLNRAVLMEEDQADVMSMDDRRMLSRYGVWLIIGLCVPNDDTPIHLLGRLLAAICQWFCATPYLPDDQQGAPIERLKNDYLQNWIQDLSKTHFEVFVSCLLPHPVDYAKVGGHWDTLASKSEHIKEGFHRLFRLVPYDLITISVWERVMPHWMEAIHNEVCEKDLHEMKMTLSKLLDPEMSPLGFDATQMYTFISKRFNNTNEAVQEQTLSWLQMLSSLSIIIPIYQLLEMFQEGTKALLERTDDDAEASSDKPEEQPTLEPVIEDVSEIDPGEWHEHGSSWGCSESDQTANEKTLSCFILMFDVFYKQLEVQEIERHKGVNGPVSIPFLTLMKEMLRSPCLSPPHKCAGDTYCTTCDLTISYFQLTMDILAYLLPLLAIQNNRVADMIPPTPTSKADVKVEGTDSASVTLSPKASTTDSAKKADGVTKVVTATVETVIDMEMTANVCQEEVLSAVATVITHSASETDSNKAAAKVTVDLPSVVNENDEPIDLTRSIDAEDSSFWITSQGKFKFRLEELPPHLQVVYAMLHLLESAEDCDIVYHLCECLRYLILHGESLAQAAADHRGFLIWCQENKNINLMWNMIEAEWSHVAEVCALLLLHFLQLPCGSDIFWKLCENHFHHSDWKVRFQAVEKVVVVGRFLTVVSVKQCPGLQAAIAHAFCFLLNSLDDMHVAVAKRSHLYLGSIPDSGLRALTWCLEQQFDSVILDRPMIIQALHQLSSLLPERKILAWEFFYSRFDALYIEAQLALEKLGEIAFPRDLRNSDMTSDIFARKLSRAQDALSQVQNVKTLSSSLGTKWPYKRTMSAPANMFNRMDKQGESSTKAFDDATMVEQLQRAMDLEQTDKDTLHLLIFLLMHFLSQPQHATGNEDKTSAKVMSMVLRHLSILMGYSTQERSFAITPSRLRALPVFNAYLSCLPQVLDHNFNMARLLLPTCLPVLQFCPAPHRMVDLRYPKYSLWHLEPQPRRWWLTSVLTIMYKFDYSQQLFSWQIISLIRIVLNSLENHFHRCRKMDVQSVFSTNLPYSRDISQGSLGATDGQQTPPPSPVAAAAPTLEDKDSPVSKDKKEHIDKIPKITECVEPVQVIPSAELATVCIERPEGVKQAVVETVNVGSSITVDCVKPRAVTAVMAKQIQSFDESVVRMHGVQLASAETHYSVDVKSSSQPDSSENSEISSEGNHPSWSTDMKQRMSIDKSSSSSRDDSTTTTTNGKKAIVILKDPMAVSYAVETRHLIGPVSDKNGKKCYKHASAAEGYADVCRTFSPKSPLSMMDMITVESPVELNGSESFTVHEVNAENSQKPLELPTPERLLQARPDMDFANFKEEPFKKGALTFDQWKGGMQFVNVDDVKLTEVVCHSDKSKQNQKTPPGQKEFRKRCYTDETSDRSNTATSGHSGNDSIADDKKKRAKSKGWEDIGGSFYSWSEPSEGSSSRGDKEKQPHGTPSTSVKQSALRTGEDCMVYRCMECGEALEEFSNEDLGTCVIILATFVHREPGLAAPLLPRLLRTVARVAGSEVFSWQYSTPVHLPGCSRSIGRQFIRCVLHQLAPNQIFNQIFQIDIPDPEKVKLFKTLLHSLLDFNELNISAPIQLLLENLNSQKVLPSEKLLHLIGNMATYMECATHEISSGMSSSLIPHFDTFLRKLVLCVQTIDIRYLVRFLLAILKVPGIAAHKNILEPYSKLLSFAIQNAPLKLETLHEICYVCNKIISRERDKQLLPRLIIFELVQAMKFKTNIPDKNLVMLVQLLLQDCGGTLEPNTILDSDSPIDSHFTHNTNLAECMRSHLNDALEFIADVHTITKVKATCKTTSGLNEDTLGGLVKAGIAQYLALEITRGNSRDNRTTLKYLPWLNSAPTAVQQGSKEFIECVVHIRLLSWLLLGSLTHLCLSGSANVQCQPVPPEASCHIADHIQVILGGFPEHSKNTVQHMSSLYQTFILAQLWTLYMEQVAGTPSSDSHVPNSAILTDFWAKITPAILQLVAYSKVLGEMVALHLMSLMESLQECQSSVLTKLLPLWAPVLYTQQSKMPGQILVRLRACQDAILNSAERKQAVGAQLSNTALPSLQNWLHRLQFKMGQIEMQSSAAIQFYPV